MKNASSCKGCALGGGDVIKWAEGGVLGGRQKRHQKDIARVRQKVQAWYHRDHGESGARGKEWGPGGIRGPARQCAALAVLWQGRCAGK